MSKTYAEIREKIKKRKAVVVTAEEIIEMVEKNGKKETLEKVDVVTTATFSPMCSSGAMLNFGHSKPKIKFQKTWLNDVSAYTGLAAVDSYIGATEVTDKDAKQNVSPKKFEYGGGHVIEDLVRGRDVKLTGESYGTDDYPRKEFEGYVNLDELNEAYLLNPRNCYQSYPAAVNCSDKTIYTYLGTLEADQKTLGYSSAGELSPLINDPFYKTIGIGTRIWLAGAQGYVYWQGTQHNPHEDRNEKGVPIGGAGTLALVGDLKQMNADYLRGVSLTGYGTSLSVGVGIPIPLLNEDILEYVSIRNKDIKVPIIDYSDAYPNRRSEVLGHTNYEDLRSGEIELDGKKIKTHSMSSLKKAREIAEILKDEISNGRFLLTEPVQLLPSNDDNSFKFKPLNIRDKKREYCEKVDENKIVTSSRVSICKDNNNCTHCGACVSHCPTGALSVEDGEVVYDPGKCISCRGCLASCPYGGIREKSEN